VALGVQLDDIDARMAEYNAALAEQLKKLEERGESTEVIGPGIETEWRSWEECAWDRWRLLLWMGLRDNTHSLHWHWWPTALYGGNFSYVARGAEYGLVGPESDLAPHLTAAWRQRLISGLRGRLRRRFFPRIPVAGELRTVLRGEAVDWVVTCWSVGTAEGVDIYRMTPLPSVHPTEEMTATAGDKATAIKALVG